MREIRFRPAEPSDTKFLLDLEEAGMRRHAEALWGKWRPSATIETYDIVGHWIVSTLRYQVGCVAAERSSDELFIRRLYIAPKHQNRGFGTAVLRSMIEWAEQLALPVRLSVLSTNPAIRLYQREGFVLESETDERRILCKPLSKP